MASLSRTVSMSSLPQAVRVAIFGTHHRQFNGYSKVVYELCKSIHARHQHVDLHLFGFQNFHNHPGHRLDMPIGVTVFDASAAETPKAQGYGISVAREYVERVRPDVCVVFNDMYVMTALLNEIKHASNRASFKVVAYIDQVYAHQLPDHIAFVNQHADAAIAFTPMWRDCILGQGLLLPCHVLPHGFNPATHFPIPRRLVRRFYNISEDDFLVLNLNRNQPRKRWDVCLQAFARVVAARPQAPIKLVIATELKGSVDMVQLYQRELRKRGVDVALGMSRIVVPGHAQMLTDEETNVLYNLADVGINTCDGEGFGLCNFEQAAIGIPQIVPRVGGFRHFFDDTNAVLVDPVANILVDNNEVEISSCDDFADAILACYDSAERRDRIGRAARASLLGNPSFSWHRVADEFVDIVSKTCPPPLSPPAASVSSIASTPGQIDSSSMVMALSDAERLLHATQCQQGQREQQRAQHTQQKEEEINAPNADLLGELAALRKRIDDILGTMADNAAVL